VETHTWTGPTVPLPASIGHPLPGSYPLASDSILAIAKQLTGVLSGPPCSIGSGSVPQRLDAHQVEAACCARRPNTDPR
jgi:hypothetical protein